MPLYNVSLSSYEYHVILLYLFCIAAVFALMLFKGNEELKMSNHHIWLISGSTISKQSSRWSSGHPPSFCCCCITWTRPTAFELMFAWMRRGMVTRTVSFWLGLQFLCPAQFRAELLHPNKRNKLQANTNAQLCGSFCKHPPSSAALLVIFFAWPFEPFSPACTTVCFG